MLRIMVREGRSEDFGSAVAGELAGDGDRDDRAPFAAVFECVPAGVEAAGAAIGLGADGG